MGQPVKRRRKWLISFFVVVALGIAITVSTNGPRPVRVRAAHPKVGVVEETVTSNSVGTVEPEKTAVVASELAARILKVAVRQGPVTAGQTVFELDFRDAEAEREVARREIQASKGRLEQAELRKKKVWSDLERYRGTDVPRADVERLERDLDIARKDEEIAKLVIGTLEAQLEVLDLKIRKARVAAPFDGVVVKLLAEEGESVIPGRTLFTIHSAGPLLIRAPMDEVDMGRLELGRLARVSFDSYPGEKFEGRVHEITPAASTDQKNNRTIDIKILVPNLPPNIRAGMSANIEVVVRSRENVLHVPTHLVHDDREGRGKYVFVVGNGTAKRRFVKTGLASWETTEIAEGLTARDTLVLPLQFEDERAVSEGVRVEVLPDGR